MDLRCRTIEVGELPTLQLAGELDLASVPTVRDAVVRLVGAAPGRTIAIDLDEVTVLDDAGLGVLLGAAGRAREGGGDLVIVCNSPRLLRRFEMTGLARAVEVRDRLAR